jgi:hypothetical protein
MRDEGHVLLNKLSTFRYLDLKVWLARSGSELALPLGVRA